MVKMIFCDVCGKDLEKEEKPVFQVKILQYAIAEDMMNETQIWESWEYNLCEKHKEALSQLISKEEETKQP